MNQKILAFLPFSIFSIMSFQSNSLADTFNSRRPVEVTLFHSLFSETEIGMISGTYYNALSNSEGILFAERPLANDIRFNFVDTKGTERCIGHTTISSRGVGFWVVKGAVPGYRCSTIGKFWFWR